jgi:molybdate transport system substrate-binding protein
MILLAQGIPAEAADVKVLSAAALRPVLTELSPAFERTMGDKLVIQFDVVGVLKRQIDAGEPFDVTILTTPLLDELVKAGKIAANTRADIARSGIGVIVRSGAPKPDISSTDAFKRALLNATAISLTKDTPYTNYLASLMERLGIAEQMKPKTKVKEGVGAAAQAVAAGDADLGFTIMSAFEPVPGAELLGPLPPEIQNYVGYTAGVGATAKDEEAGKALLNFLKTPAAVAVLKAKGMEPITP